MNDFLNGCWDCELDGECDHHRLARQAEPRMTYDGLADWHGELYYSGSHSVNTDRPTADALVRMAERTGFVDDFEPVDEDDWRYIHDIRAENAATWINERSTGEGMLEYFPHGFYVKRKETV